MPELAEVELARRLWDVGSGETVTTLHTNDRARIFRNTPAKAFRTLIGTSIQQSRRHGKRAYFTFHDKLHLEVHLGMSGRMSVEHESYTPKKHDHFILYTDRHALILNDYRMFGHITCHDVETPWQALPPDPLSRTFNQKHLANILSKKSSLGLKAALLRQDLFPGIGNWMADEICWQLHYHPRRTLDQVEANALFNAVKKVCKGAIRYVADRNEKSAKDGDDGFAPGSYVANVPPAHWLFQHRWKKAGLCPRCNKELERTTVASRTTAWCRHCQPL